MMYIRCLGALWVHNLVVHTLVVHATMCVHGLNDVHTVLCAAQMGSKMDAIWVQYVLFVYYAVHVGLKWVQSVVKSVARTDPGRRKVGL